MNGTLGLATQSWENIDGKKCTCGRSLTDECVGWGKLSHSEWQTKKIIAEAQSEAEPFEEELVRLIFPDGKF